MKISRTDHLDVLGFGDLWLEQNTFKMKRSCGCHSENRALNSFKASKFHVHRSQETKFTNDYLTTLFHFKAKIVIG